jgi:4-diphosphocytidyl-2-C-methyl-D-erythritol kinase
MSRIITIEAPAKVNLTLDIKFKRPDGYHEIETVMHQINLLDHITIEAAEPGIEVYCNHPMVPNGSDNLAFRAAKLILNRYGSKEGVKIFIEKRIPVGAGLAGGSTDAAAVLTGINELFGFKAHHAELLEMAGKIGSDVPFCLVGGTALALGRGEILQNWSHHNKLNLLLVKPEGFLSTAEVYDMLDLEHITGQPHALQFAEAWDRGRIDDIAALMENVLEPVSIKLCPEINLIKLKVMEYGALKAFITGSGPTVIGVFPDQNRAERAYEGIRGLYREVFLATTYNKE